MKGNVIRLNIMHLNSVHLNSIGEVQSVSLKAGESTEDPVYPPTTYTLAANVSNGKVTATKNGTAISLPYVATEGDVIVLSVTPDEGYEFKGWLDGNKSNPRTVTMTGNVVLSASCVEIAKPTYTLSASVTNGMVSAKRNGSAVNLPFTANEGDTIVVSVTPNDGYEFNGWADGNTDNPRTITMTADVVLSAQCVEVVVPPVGNYIQFEDKAVEAICVANWSSDGIGLTEEDAAKVTDIRQFFRNNSTITTFNELEYFTGLKSLGATTGGNSYAPFYRCTSLRSVRIPKSVTLIGNSSFEGCSVLKDVGSLEYVTTIQGGAFANTLIGEKQALCVPNLTGQIGNIAFQATQYDSIDNLGTITEIAAGTSYLSGAFAKMTKLKKVRIPATIMTIGRNAFAGCSGLEQVICEATTPPTVASDMFLSTNSDFIIYVPDASLEAYRTATNWVSYADRIHPLSEIEGIVITQNTATDADFFEIKTNAGLTRKYILLNVSQASSYSMSMSVASGSPIKGCIHIKRNEAWNDNEVDSGWIVGGMSKEITNDRDADRSCPFIGVGFTYVSDGDGVPTMEEIRQYITFQIEIF